MCRFQFVLFTTKVAKQDDLETDYLTAKSLARHSRNQMGKSFHHEGHEGHEGFGKLLLRPAA
jgi:hypothetical protein